MADKTIPVGADRLPFSDDGAPTHYVDMVTEIAAANGTIRVGLGHIITNTNLEQRVVGEVYLRMNSTTAIQIAAAIMALAEKADEAMARVIAKRRPEPDHPKKARRSN